MKITKKILQKIIKEEIEKVLKESPAAEAASSVWDASSTKSAAKKAFMSRQIDRQQAEQVKQAFLKMYGKYHNNLKFDANKEANTAGMMVLKDLLSSPKDKQAPKAQVKATSADVQARIVGTKKVGDKMVVTMKDASGRTVTGEAEIRGGNFGLAKERAAANARNKLAASAP